VAAPESSEGIGRLGESGLAADGPLEAVLSALHLSRRESLRSLSTRPPVWHEGQ
jgi:hypothetical protein